MRQNNNQNMFAKHIIVIKWKKNTFTCRINQTVGEVSLIKIKIVYQKHKDEQEELWIYFILNF